MGTRKFILLAPILLLALAARFAWADGDPMATPDYSGDLWTRPALSGDWGGARTALENKGVTFNYDVIQVYQGVINGGLNSAWKYGGRQDLNVNVDSQKLGLWQGGFLNLEGESNFGQFPRARQTGTVLPADVNSEFPVSGSNQFDLSQLMYTQFLAHQFGLFAGKLTTITDTSGDMNDFAHGKGDEQFLNTSLNFDPLIAVTVPYSTLGAGFVLIPTSDPKQFLITGTVFDEEGTSVTPGFNTAFKGGTGFALEGRYTEHFFNLTGHQLVGGTYSDKLYISSTQALRNLIIPGLPIQNAHGAWNVYYNFDQYVYQPDPKVDQGLGFFGRFGLSDHDATPYHYFYSAGIGGKGLIPSRTNDQFGIGWYYAEPTNGSFLQTLRFGSAQGFEAYYAFAITPWLKVTPDVQVLSSSFHRIDSATVLGLRLKMEF